MLLFILALFPPPRSA